MSLQTVKRLASRIFGVGQSQVRIMDAQKAIDSLTADDVRQLEKTGAIKILKLKSGGRGKAKLRHAKQLLGRRTGPGRRKGTSNAKLTLKKRWTRRIRSQRKLLASIQGSLVPGAYQQMYRMIKGGFFRDKRQLLLFVEERKMRSENKK